MYNEDIMTEEELREFEEYNEEYERQHAEEYIEYAESMN